MIVVDVEVCEAQRLENPAGVGMTPLNDNIAGRVKAKVLLELWLKDLEGTAHEVTVGHETLGELAFENAVVSFT
jgi:hypothetical protein